MTKQLSSKLTFFNKRIFPTFWFLLLIYFGINDYLNGDKVSFGASLLMVLAGIAIFLFLFNNVADKVEDHGNFIRVYKANRNLDIPFEDIKTVEWLFSNSMTVTIVFNSDTQIGRRVRFIPKCSFVLYGMHFSVFEFRDKILSFKSTKK